MKRNLPQAPRTVITGAGSGLGRALAVHLARRHARVLLADVDAVRAEETAELVAHAGGSPQTLRCDVTRPDDLERAALHADKAWGGTDLLINNAGVAAAGAIGEMPVEDWEWLVRIDLFGVIHGCHAFVPRMKERQHGFVLNVASCAGIVAMPEMGAYNVSKAAVIALSETLSAEVAPWGIGVSVLCPTFFKTNLMETFRSPSVRQRQLANALFQRSAMTADQVATTAIRGLERGKLMIIPQADGSFLWRAKRVAPATFSWLAGKVYGARLVEKALLSGP